MIIFDARYETLDFRQAYDKVKVVLNFNNSKLITHTS